MGFRLIEKTNELNIVPTPIATPTRLMRGIELDKYLKPNNIQLVNNPK